MLADKLTYWIDTMDVGMEDVLGAVRRIEAQHERLASGDSGVLSRVPKSA